MQVDEELLIPCVPEELAPWIEDLSAYPHWMGLVHRAERLATPDPGELPAWSVDLRARLGPLARSKRLRMVRTAHARPGLVRFERRELDGRRHGGWVLSAEYGPAPAGNTNLVVGLSYEGALWTAGLLERTLHDEIRRAKERLVILVSKGGSPDAAGDPTR